MASKSEIELDTPGNMAACVLHAGRHGAKKTQRPLLMNVKWPTLMTAVFDFDLARLAYGLAVQVG